jgi:hypothetical protein
VYENDIQLDYRWRMIFGQKGTLELGHESAEV